MRTVRLREGLGSESGRRSEPAGGPEDCGRARARMSSTCHSHSFFVGVTVNHTLTTRQLQANTDAA